MNAVQLLRNFVIFYCQKKLFYPLYQASVLSRARQGQNPCNSPSKGSRSSTRMNGQVLTVDKALIIKYLFLKTIQMLCKAAMSSLYNSVLKASPSRKTPKLDLSVIKKYIYIQIHCKVAPASAAPLAKKRTILVKNLDCKSKSPPLIQSKI